MENALRGEADAISLISKMGKGARISYMYRLSSRVRHLMYFDTFCDTIDTYLREV